MQIFKEAFVGLKIYFIIFTFTLQHYKNHGHVLKTSNKIKENW